MRISDCSLDVCSSDLSRFAAWELPQKPSTFCGLQRAADADSQIAGSVYPKLPTSMRPASRAASSPVGVTRLIAPDRTSAVEGKRVSVGVDLGGRRIRKKKVRTIKLLCKYVNIN